MRYLSLPELEQINSILNHLESDDGTRITGRLEAYSCKAAGSDKKLLKRLSDRFQAGERRDDIGDILGSSPPLGSGRSSEIIALNTLTGENLPFKAFYYLIATMNLLFPDYDFSELKSEAFRAHPQLAAIVSHVNTTLFNTGIDKNLITFGEFSAHLWERIDLAIGLADSEVYSFTPDVLNVDDDATEDDPFWERGCM